MRQQPEIAPGSSAARASSRSSTYITEPPGVQPTARNAPGQRDCATLKLRRKSENSVIEKFRSRTVITCAPSSPTASAPSPDPSSGSADAVYASELPSGDHSSEEPGEVGSALRLSTQLVEARSRPSRWVIITPPREPSEKAKASRSPKGANSGAYPPRVPGRLYAPDAICPPPLALPVALLPVALSLLFPSSGTM